MKYTKEYIARMRVASNLLEPPANEVVVELLDEISRLQEEARWIPVNWSNKLPKNMYPCEFLTDDTGMVTHYRPLPQPPESEG